MKIDFNIELKTLKGETLKDSEKNNITLKTVTINCLLGESNDDKMLSGEKKLEKYLLAEKIYTSESEIDIKSDEISMIKKIISENYPPLISGQCWLIMEGDRKWKK